MGLMEVRHIDEVRKTPYLGSVVKDPETRLMLQLTSKALQNPLGLPVDTDCWIDLSKSLNAFCSKSYNLWGLDPWLKAPFSRILMPSGDGKIVSTLENLSHVKNLTPEMFIDVCRPACRAFLENLIGPSTLKDFREGVYYTESTVGFAKWTIVDLLSIVPLLGGKLYMAKEAPGWTPNMSNIVSTLYSGFCHGAIGVILAPTSNYELFLLSLLEEEASRLRKEGCQASQILTGCGLTALELGCFYELKGTDVATGVHKNKFSKSRQQLVENLTEYGALASSYGLVVPIQLRGLDSQKADLSKIKAIGPAYEHLDILGLEDQVEIRQLYNERGLSDSFRDAFKLKMDAVIQRQLEEPAGKEVVAEADSDSMPEMKPAVNSTELHDNDVVPEMDTSVSVTEIEPTKSVFGGTVEEVQEAKRLEASTKRTLTVVAIALSGLLILFVLFKIGLFAEWLTSLADKQIPFVSRIAGKLSAQDTLLHRNKKAHYWDLDLNRLVSADSLYRQFAKAKVIRTVDGFEIGVSDYDFYSVPTFKDVVGDQWFIHTVRSGIFTAYRWDGEILKFSLGDMVTVRQEA